jgi:PleD family two-component response regulator
MDPNSTVLATSAVEYGRFKRSILTRNANEALAYSRYIFKMALIGARMPDLKNSILIVEDEESVRTSLAMVLSRLGLRVRSASDGLAALMEMRHEALTFCFQI